MSGLFISFEGNDGAGKSTQAELLKKYLTEKNYRAVMLREPGGTEIGEKIRDIILDSANTKMKFMTEAMLYAAARCQLVYEKILPALKGGQVVICDRFVDSSLVYQGIGRGLGVERVFDLNQYATGGLKPDITFFLHLSPEEGIKRKKEQKNLDRIENEKNYFHNKVYKGFLEIAKTYTDRIVTVEANRSIEEIGSEIAETVEKYINENSL